MGFTVNMNFLYLEQSIIVLQSTSFTDCQVTLAIVRLVDAGKLGTIKRRSIELKTRVFVK